MALFLVDELLDSDLPDFDEALLECNFFPNKDRLGSLSRDSSPCSTSCTPCVWSYTRFHLVCQTKPHLPLLWLYLLSIDNIPPEPLMPSWIGHQTDEVLLSLYSHSELNTEVDLWHLSSVASVNEVHLFFLLECSCMLHSFLCLFMLSL